MIITFPFENDPYYEPLASLPARSYPQSIGANTHTPALVQKYINLYSGMSSGTFPVGANRFWHGGVHLSGTQPIRAIANGTIVAYRLDDDYYDSELAKLATPPQTRQFSSCFVLIRHELEANNGINTLNRYKGAHFYSLYANLLPKKQLETKSLLPPFLSTGGDRLKVSVLRGDKAEVLALNSDGHKLIKLRLTDVNSAAAVEGWAELMNVDTSGAAPAVGTDALVSYPFSSVYKHHPSEKQWRTLGSAQFIDQSVRVGEIIGYAGQTDSASNTVANTFHFEIAAEKNLWVKPAAMKPLNPLLLNTLSSSHQLDAANVKCDAMGKVWLTRNTNLLTIAPANNSTGTPTSLVTAADVVAYSKGACFLAAIPVDIFGASTTVANKAVCFQLLDMNGRGFYAFKSAAAATAQANAAASLGGNTLLSTAWVTLTSDTDWQERGWLAYKDKDLSGSADGFVEDNDAVMQKILSQAGKTAANMTDSDLQTSAMATLLRQVAVKSYTEWDSSKNIDRYTRLKTGVAGLPKLTDPAFDAFINDTSKQQFWSNQIHADGPNALLQPDKTSPLPAIHWHFNPIGFLAQMRECLSTDPFLGEEAFERELRDNWWIAYKLIDKRLTQLQPWNSALTSNPTAPAGLPTIARDYVLNRTYAQQSHSNLWSNFEYWFGVTPNTAAAPQSQGGALASQRAGDHVYNYMKGMKEFFRHVSTQRVMAGQFGIAAGAYVYGGAYPPNALEPRKGSFSMEYIHIACQYGYAFKAYNSTAAVDQNRMQVQMHEIAHLRNTAYADDQKVVLPSNTTNDPKGVHNTTAYGAMSARILAEIDPNLALANAENIAFFIESVKNEP
jgi:hypothetical protein